MFNHVQKLIFNLQWLESILLYTETDRAGLTLSGTDIEHINWKDGNTEQTTPITV